MKKIILLYGLFVAIIILTSCQKETITTTETMTSTSTTTTTTTQTITTNTTTPTKSCKAINYDYDEDNLEYELVWEDDFNIDGFLDPEKWSYHTGGSGFGNNELQYYTDGDNLTVENGILTIEARKEQYGSNEYTSSKIWTRYDQSWLYGKFEIRARLPEGKGTWPAIWMMPTTSSYGVWPRSGEIDIMEHVGYEMNRVHGSVHT